MVACNGPSFFAMSYVCALWCYPLSIYRCVMY